MSSIFWIAVGVMTLTALFFVMRPFLGINRSKVPLVLMVGLPVFAAAIYLAIGSPGTARSPAAPAAATVLAQPKPTEDGKVDSVSNLVDGLAARLAENPDDGKGWLLLAQSYEHLGRTDEAADAYQHARELGQYSDTLENLATGGDASIEPAAAGTGAAITGRVSLAPEIAKLVSPSDTVFIFARGAGEKGAPAAVVRKPATDWPIEFRLTDAQSMVDGIRLSNYENVIVTARVSRSGNASDPLQNIEAKSDAVSVRDGSPVELLIQ